jgi:putative acetyltransferase
MDNSPDTAQNFREMVDAILQSAFETADEAKLVDQLRRDKDLAGEIVLKGTQGLIGYAALSKMVAPKGWYCLAPVAVDPAAQGQGHGKTILAMVLKWAAERDATVVVLGNPDFYGAHGFSTERAARLQTHYPVKYMLLAGPGDDAPKETLIYPAAFDELD